MDGDVKTTARISHLLSALPESVHAVMAFHDREHAYLPGWEVPKIQKEYFTSHKGFISDYISELFHTELRRRNYTNNNDRIFLKKGG
jgi:ATP-dependent Lon protease